MDDSNIIRLLNRQFNWGASQISQFMSQPETYVRSVLEESKALSEVSPAAIEPEIVESSKPTPGFPTNVPLSGEAVQGSSIDKIKKQEVNKQDTLAPYYTVLELKVIMAINEVIDNLDPGEESAHIKISNIANAYTKLTGNTIGANMGKAEGASETAPMFNIVNVIQ